MATEKWGSGAGQKAPMSPRTPIGSGQLSSCSGPSKPHRARTTVTHPVHAAPRRGQQVPGAWGMLDRLRPALPYQWDVWDAQGGERNPLPALPTPCPDSAQPGSPPALDGWHSIPAQLSITPRLSIPARLSNPPQQHIPPWLSVPPRLSISSRLSIPAQLSIPARLSIPPRRDAALHNR